MKSGTSNAKGARLPKEKRCRGCGQSKPSRDFYQRIVKDRKYLHANCKPCHSRISANDKKMRNAQREMTGGAALQQRENDKRLLSCSITHTATPQRPTLPDLKNVLITAITNPDHPDHDVLTRLLLPYTNSGIIDTIRGFIRCPLSTQDELVLDQSDEWKLTNNWKGKVRGFFRQRRHRDSGTRIGNSSTQTWFEGSVPKIRGMSNDRVHAVGQSDTLESLNYFTRDLLHTTLSRSSKHVTLTRIDLAVDFDLLDVTTRQLSKGLRNMKWKLVRTAPRQKSHSQIGGQVAFGRKTGGEKMALSVYNKFDEMHLNSNGGDYINQHKLPDNPILRTRTRCEIQIRGSRMMKHVCSVLEPGTDFYIRKDHRFYGYKLDLNRLRIAHLLFLLDLKCDDNDSTALSARSQLIYACHPFLSHFIKHLNRKDTRHEITSLDHQKALQGLRRTDTAQSAITSRTRNCVA